MDQRLERVARLDARIEEEAQRPGIAPAVARLKTLRGVRTLKAMTIHSEWIDRKRRGGQLPDVIESARKAEARLYRKFTRMVMRGMRTTVINAPACLRAFRLQSASTAPRAEEQSGKCEWRQVGFSRPGW